MGEDRTEMKDFTLWTSGKIVLRRGGGHAKALVPDGRGTASHFVTCCVSPLSEPQLEAGESCRRWRQRWEGARAEGLRAASRL